MEGEVALRLLETVGAGAVGTESVVAGTATAIMTGMSNVTAPDGTGTPSGAAMLPSPSTASRLKMLLPTTLPTATAVPTAVPTATATPSGAEGIKSASAGLRRLAGGANRIGPALLHPLALGPGGTWTGRQVLRSAQAPG